MFTPPALELDFVPIVGELDWVLVVYLSLKVFIWLCPPDVVREHVAQSRAAREQQGANDATAHHPDRRRGDYRRAC